MAHRSLYVLRTQYSKSWEQLHPPNTGLACNTSFLYSLLVIVCDVCSSSSKQTYAVEIKMCTFSFAEQNNQHHLSLYLCYWYWQLESDESCSTRNIWTELSSMMYTYIWKSYKWSLLILIFIFISEIWLVSHLICVEAFDWLIFIACSVRWIAMQHDYITWLSQWNKGDSW